MNIAITKMSSKGQIVIPVDMRENIEEGEKLVIIENDGQFIVESIDRLSKNLEEDLEFARRTEEALKRYDKGEFISIDFDDFLEEAKKW